jgi:hypothetical protein
MPIDSGPSGMAAGAHRPCWGRRRAILLSSGRASAPSSTTAAPAHTCRLGFESPCALGSGGLSLQNRRSERSGSPALCHPRPAARPVLRAQRFALVPSAEPHLRSLNDAWPICSQHSAAVTCSAIAHRPAPVARRPYAVAQRPPAVDRPIGARRHARCHSRIGLGRRGGGAALCAADAVLCAARQAHRVSLGSHADDAEPRARSVHGAAAAAAGWRRDVPCLRGRSRRSGTSPSPRRTCHAGGWVSSSAGEALWARRFVHDRATGRESSQRGWSGQARGGWEAGGGGGGGGCTAAPSTASARRAT